MPKDPFSCVESILELKTSGERAVADGEAMAAWGRGLVALHHKIRTAISAEQMTLEDGAEEASGAIATSPSKATAVQSQPTTRLKQDGTPAKRPGRKPRSQHVTEGRTSLLTACVRHIIERFLQDGPRTITSMRLDIANTDDVFPEWASSDESFEAVLCEDPEGYVRWMGRREGDSTDVELWGTDEQFYAAAKDATDDFYGLDSRPKHVKSLCDVMGCGASAAARALDRAVASRAAP